MEAWLLVLITFALILLLLASGMWISGALAIVGFVVLLVFVPGNREGLVAMLAFNAVNIYTYTMLPLFIFMGDIILRSGLSARLYRGATAWVGPLPGGLLHTNIAACAIFSAVSGSSMATAATIATVALPELEKRGYNRKLLLGSLAAGGTLGILIPPSIGLVIYGTFVEESIGRLFMAAVIPGAILAALFMTYIGIASLINPSFAPDRLKFSLKAMASSTLDILPLVALILLVLGTIYLGLATPTESAAMGAVMSLVLCALYRRLTFNVFKQAALTALKITCWAMLIVIGAQVLSAGLAYMRVPAQLAALVTSLEVPRMVIFALVVLLYIILGMFIEAISMMLLTLAVIYPVMMALGFDSIWFGVMMVIFIEMGQITPPVGVNLYVLYGITGKRYLSDIIYGVIPFFLCQVVLVIILAAFPNLALWLPRQMFRRTF